MIRVHDYDFNCNYTLVIITLLITELLLLVVHFLSNYTYTVHVGMHACLSDNPLTIYFQIEFYLLIN